MRPLACSPARWAMDMEIVDAIYETLKTLDYSSNFNVAHRGGFEVASRLSRILPEGINRVFFGNSGSEAIESAIKIVMAYNRAAARAIKSAMSAGSVPITA